MACAAPPDDTPLDPCDTAACDDTDEPDWEPAGQISVHWDPAETDGTVQIDVDARSGAVGFWLGMSETAAGEAGWYEEDGIGPNAHSFTGLSASLAYVDAPEDVVLGESTRFDGGSDGIDDAFTADGADRLSYLLILRDGPNAGHCYVWGHDPSYYDSLGCNPI